MIGFDTLDSKARIFSELKSGKYDWWKVLRDNPLFYCEVRKDNQVNVYFEGGSVARLHYCSRHKALQAFAHRKYLGIDDGPTYVNCADTLSAQVNEMLDRIKKNYSRKKGDGKEGCREGECLGRLELEPGIIGERDTYKHEYQREQRRKGNGTDHLEFSTEISGQCMLLFYPHFATKIV